MDGHFHDLKQGFGAHMAQCYAGLFADTPDLQSFKNRGFVKSFVWVPGRMVDEVEAMLATYQKNKNSVLPGEYAPGANALFPVVFMGTSKDYIPTGGDFGGRQVGRRLVALVDGPGASVYGYRQAMGDVRAQLVIMSAETMTAQSLAAQISLFLGEVKNRRFTVTYDWGQYQIGTVCMLETPDILFSLIKSGNTNMTILAADLTLKVVFPYLDAPGDGDENDGSDNDPPGYPLVERFNILNEVTMEAHVVQVEDP